MRITNGIIASCILGIISAVDQHEEMRCKARPGCHLAKCDPGLLSPSLNANEYPVTCVRTSAQDGGEYNELKSEMGIIRTDSSSYASRISTLEKKIKKTTSDFTSRISTLENENEKTTAEMEALKTQLSKLVQSNEALLKELNALKTKTNDLESHLAKPKTDLSTRIIAPSPTAALARSCEDAQSARNGVFKLDIPEVGIKNVFCDVTDDGGNWTVFQRRMNGAVDFYRGWDDYVKGFGDLQGDHWLGLEALHQLTKKGNMEMKIKMIKRDGIYWFAKYSSFRVGPGSDFYRLHASGYSGNASGNGLYNNLQFTTKDADHDGALRWNCASDNEGGWWYHEYCGLSNLNGNFNKTGTTNKGIWWGWDGDYNLLRFSEMKFRQRA